MKDETVMEFLNRLSTTTSSSDKDSLYMEALLHRLDFSNARVVTGIVYMEGKGTMCNPPSSIHSCAKVLLEYVKRLKPKEP